YKPPLLNSDYIFVEEPHIYQIRDGSNDGISQSLLIFSANSNPLFRSVKLRSKKSDCVICGDHPTITTLQDYVQFCGSGALDKSPSVKLLGDDERIDPKSYCALRAKGIPHVLVDVREPVQFNILDCITIQT
ncbi:9129_t:CDS:2, partial [Dentiscutata heterogama]